MAQQAQQQGGGSSDNSMATLWIMALLFITVAVIWYSAHEYIVSFVFFITILQAKVVNFFLVGEPLANDIYLMQTLNPASVNWKEMVEFAGNTGQYIRYPLIVILLILSALLYRSDIRHKYRVAHDMKSLRNQEQYNWTAIMPVVKEDLVNTDINTGPWAMAMSPMEFARKYNLLKKDDLLLDNPLPGQEMTAGIRRADAKRIFTLQLGPSWDGFDRAPPHARALAAVFLARINRDRESASMILKSLDKSFAEGKPDYSIAYPTLKKYQDTEAAQEIIDHHAYLVTVMASLLEKSRDDGVVPSSEFLWVKPIDRRLWYMLNCVGRQTPFSEVGGPFAHWRAEKAMGRRSLIPMIDEAIKALEIAVKSVRLTPKEMRELQP